MKLKRWRFVGAGFLVLLVIAGMLSAPVFAQGGTAVKVAPASSAVNVGNTIDVFVNIENIVNLYGIELDVSFDANLLEVVDSNPNEVGIQVEHGGFLVPDLPVVNNVENGVIIYAVTQISPTVSATGSGALIKITFRGKAAGTSNVNINDVQLADPNGNAIVAAIENGSVTVNASVTTTPEPTPDNPTPTPDNPTPTPDNPTPTPEQPTPTPLPPPNPTPTPQSPPPPPPNVNCGNIQGYHVVKRGETLYAIGRAYATYPPAIARCNNLVNPGTIHLGNRLAIPISPWSPVPPGPTAAQQFTPGSPLPPPAPPPTTTCRYNHVVNPGETLTLIGWRYGVNIWSIARANNILNLNLIYAGRILCIP